MKALKLLWLVFLISSSFSFGQNYQTINSNRISYFNNAGGSIQCVRIDSVNDQSDSILYPFSNIHYSEYGCFSPYGPSWIGRKIILKKDGSNVFFNKDNDSIFIKTSALLNDSWIAFTLPDSIKIMATVVGHDTMSFLGLLDSVKSIGFQVYDKNMIPLDYPLNTMILKLSKSFGFVTTFNFYLFPVTDEYSVERFENYTLIGLSNPKTGIQNLTWSEIFDFQTGDELHIVNESRQWGDAGNYQRNDKTILKYLSRIDYDDSIVYTYSQTHSLYFTSQDTSYYNYETGTGKEVIRSNPEFDLLPGEPFISENNDQIYFYSMTNGSVLTKLQPTFSGIYYFSSDSCWVIPVDGESCSNYEYYKGLGGPYYNCSGFTFDDISKLVYYKKGDVTWGTPLVITGVRDSEIKTKINVFPNPAEDFVNVQMEDPGQSVLFEIYDMKGQNVLIKNIVSKVSKIGISELEPGIYIYRIQDNTGILKTDKLIIR